jgi:hypothetical protein
MRSPNYPAYGLAETIQMAKAIWKKEERTAVSPDVAVKALGYQTLNGTARTKLASLRKFGLLEAAKSGGERISDLAMNLLHSTTDSPEYSAAIQEAALKPELYREIYRSHPKGSDDAIRSFLKISKAFSESGAAQFLEAYRATLKLANLDGGAYTASVNGNKPGKKPEKTPMIGDTVQWESQGVLQLPVPRRIRALSEDGEWAFIDGSNTGIPVKELTVVPAIPENPKPPLNASLAPPVLSEEQAPWQDVFSLAEGRVVLSWPAALSKDSYEDLSAWLDIVKRKIARSIKTGEHSA